MTLHKPKFRVPDAYVLIAVFILMAGLATYLVPAGSYERVKSEVTGKQTVVPDSFRYHEQQAPQNPVRVLMAIPTGLEKVAVIVFMVLLVGGGFQIINDTGAVDRMLGSLIRRFETHAIWIIPALMLVMSVLGALCIIVNGVIALIPIGLLLARKIRLDPVVGISVMYLGAYSGFVATPMGVVNTLLGQQIAGLTPLSGFGLRLIVWAAVFAVTACYVMRYARRVMADPANSVMDKGLWLDDVEKETVDAHHRFTLRYALIYIVLLIGFVIYGYGVFNLNWAGFREMSAMMIAVGVICGFIGGLNPSRIAKSFVKGCQLMVYGALIAGFAKSISLVLENGQVLDTIIHAMASPLQSWPPVLSGIGMFWINLVFNFFVPSGTGQAYIVMPILAPMADVVGLSRQIAVSAYQYGDGFSNIIIPTSGVLMAVLGVAKVPYDRWMKFIFPLFLLWVLIGTIAIATGVLIHWS